MPEQKQQDDSQREHWLKGRGKCIWRDEGSLWRQQVTGTMGPFCYGEQWGE